MPKRKLLSLRDPIIKRVELDFIHGLFTINILFVEDEGDMGDEGDERDEGA